MADIAEILEDIKNAIDRHTDMVKEIAKAIHENFTSTNECDSNLENANVVDGLFFMARGLHRIAEAIEGQDTTQQEERE